MTLLKQSRKLSVFQKMLKTMTSTPLQIPPAKLKVFSCRKSHLTTAVIFSRPRGATMEEGKRQIFFLIATIISFLTRNTSVRLSNLKVDLVRFSTALRNLTVPEFFDC